MVPGPLPERRLQRLPSGQAAPGPAQAADGDALPARRPRRLLERPLDPVPQRRPPIVRQELEQGRSGPAAEHLVARKRGLCRLPGRAGRRGTEGAARPAVEGHQEKPVNRSEEVFAGKDRIMRRMTFLALVLILLLVPRGAAAVWPGKEWDTASPESQGMSGPALDEAAAFAQKHEGVSGCVVRHGYLVKEWGTPTTLADIKSATKGSVGCTVLGLAVDAGLAKLDDLAVQHYPKIGVEKEENVKKGWLDRITVRQLATMTAGFDDGRPPLLVYEPGTRGIYSNDTANMLAELLTLKFREDLRTVLKRQVMDPIGAPADQWRWRDNNYRAKTIDGLASREFASGITITDRALARVGYLYLHQGEWDGKRILSREFIQAATRPTDLPPPWPYYAFYWGSNARGTYADIPRDAFWALGLGDSFVVVCPSLDLVAVRLGAGSKKSQLPDDGNDDWGGRVASFFRLVVKAVKDPYPRSPVIADVTWAPKEKIIRKAQGSDNWPMTWGDDDQLYTAYGDGKGFDAKTEKLSLGLDVIKGGPDDCVGANL